MTKKNVISRVRHSTVSCCRHNMAAQGCQHEIVSFLGYDARVSGYLVRELPKQRTGLISMV